MKKVIALMLMLVMMMAFAAPAYAADVKSPTSTEEDLIPIIIEIEHDEDFVAVTAEHIAEMPEEALKVFMEARKNLEAGVPEGMAVRYFFYLLAKEDAVTTSTNVKFNRKALLTADVSDADINANIVVKQFVNSEWVEVELEVSEDGNILAKDMVDGPVAIFIK